MLGALKKKPKAVAAWDAVRLKIPLYGNFYLKAELARFARTLEIALSNGIAFLEGLRISAPTLSNSLLRDAINQCEESVQKGDPFGKCLRRYEAFPHFMTDLILIGEETGRLEEVLAEIAEAYEQETDEFAMTLTTLIEPVMILAIGAVVGFIVIAMMLPMFEISAVL